MSYEPLGFSFTSIKSEKSLTVRGQVEQMEFSILAEWFEQHNGRELCSPISAVSETAQKVSARSQNVMENGNNAPPLTRRLSRWLKNVDLTRRAKRFLEPEIRSYFFFLFSVLLFGAILC